MNEWKGLEVHTFLKYNKDKHKEQSLQPSVAPNFHKISKQQDCTLSILLQQAYFWVWGTNIISVINTLHIFLNTRCPCMYDVPFHSIKFSG